MSAAYSSQPGYSECVSGVIQRRKQSLRPICLGLVDSPPSVKVWLLATDQLELVRSSTHSVSEASRLGMCVLEVKLIQCTVVVCSVVDGTCLTPLEATSSSNTIPLELAVVFIAFMIVAA